MSNMFGSKNPPWARGSNQGTNSLNQNQLILQQSSLNQLGSNSGMVQYQQPQVFQTNMGLQQSNIGLGLSQLNTVLGNNSNSGISNQISSNQLFNQVGTVQYPTPRSLSNNYIGANNMNKQDIIGNNTQRVFTGTVTKLLDNFGFVDDDVFFQTSVCVDSNPQVGDRVLVEATFNANMPFKWNATRIQELPKNSTAQSSSRHPFSKSSSYNAVPPPSDNANYSSRSSRPKGSVGRGRSRERSRDDEDAIERKRRREMRERSREAKDKKVDTPPPRRRSRSPKRTKRPIVAPRYMVHIPKVALDLPNADYLEVRRRYANLYVPSDFFSSNFRWVDAFPPNAPFNLNKPCTFHIMYKDIEPPTENPAVLEPADADYRFSAKVMLLSMPAMQEVYQKCCSMAEDKEKRDRDSEERVFVHPTRLFNFLVGLRGKNETMALGGPWSPSLDGPDPEKNPTVLINTAIRTCRALTGIDLSTCTQWYRFVELFYRRGESTHKGKVYPARVETVVLFLPDVWSCVPTRIEWDGLHHSYRKKLDQILNPDQQPKDAEGAVAATTNADCSSGSNQDEKVEAVKLKPTHYSELDPKSMNLTELRRELDARNISSKGIKSQLAARLNKALRTESDLKIENVEESEDAEMTEKGDDDNDKSDEVIDEKERILLEKRYSLPETPSLIVHPSKIAKSGKFDCTVMSLSLLLDYRPEDTKEHSFEVSLFAELFNEMLMRDFGFHIYKAICLAPEQPKEEPKDDKKKDDKKDSKRKKDDKKSESSEKEDDEDTNDSKKKSNHKSDKRKKPEKSKTITVDPKLLLAFVYFDQTHCGYIFQKDIEDLIFTLGLQLSRAQVRKAVTGVITRDSLHYRKLTDKTKEELAEEKEAVAAALAAVGDLDQLAAGNKALLPVFKSIVKTEPGEKKPTDVSEGFVMYQGGLLNVEKLMTQLKRIEKACAETEGRLVELKSDNKKLHDKNSRANNTVKELTSDLKEYKDKLHIANSQLVTVTACSKLFHCTLRDIKKQVDHAINHKLYTDSAETRASLASHESRWSEADDKKSTKKDDTKVDKESARTDSEKNGERKREKEDKKEKQEEKVEDNVKEDEQSDVNEENKVKVKIESVEKSS